MTFKLPLIVGFVVSAASASAQQMTPSALSAGAFETTWGKPAWKFGPVMPHITDAAKRTVYGLAVGAAFMGFGIGIDKLNHQQCAGSIGCFDGNPVQSGISFAMLGVLLGGTGPTLHSKCTRSGRAILGIVGGAIGTTVAGAMVHQPMFTAKRGDPATFRVMGSGLLGMSAGTGIASALC